MMDNYEPSRRITADTLTKLDDIHPVKLQEQSDFFNCIQELNINKQNFNFGAEILNTATMSSSTSTYNSYGEEETKTNIEIIKTFAMAAPSTDQLQPSLVEDSQHGGNKVLMNATDLRKQQVNSQSYGMHETNNKEDDEEDSYQTDDNDNSQISQASSHVRSLGGNSAENGDEDDDSNDEDSDDSESSDSDFSDLSGLSDMSGKDWKPINQRPLNWVQKQIQTGANPREILSKFLPSSAQRLSPDLTDMTLWRILASMLSEPPRRQKLSYVNTFDDVINLVQKSKNIIVLTGAGVSVSCGIPDFRSSDGIYSRLAKDYPNLPDPQAMFDINYFSRDPRPFFKFAREIYPGQFKPSPCHRFIKMLEQKQKLLRNYTQNIDTLEQVAGIKNVIECHGSFSTASCTKCKYKSDADSIRADIFAQRIPACPRCQPNVEQSVEASQPVSELELRRLVENGIMKPDIVFFGEGLPDEFHTVMASDKDKCDLLIVMGSSLKVRPVALIPSSIPANIPQILINREQLHHLEFDVELLGDGDVIINQICHRLADDWKDICFDDEVLCESQQLIPLEEDDHEMAKELMTSDNDTLSVKSNQSDLALQSTTTTYSDSGFESSSTLSTTMTSNNVANRKQGEFLLPDDLEDPMDSASANATSFAGSCDYRHLSIDSSKDSGILGDLSNPASSAALNLPPPPASCNHNVSNFEDINKSFNMPASSTQQQSLVNNLQNTKTAASNCSTANDKELPCRQRKPQSAAERLHKGTYYVHENSSAYVFPGAQVSWFTDSEDEEEVATCEIRDSENCVKDYEDSDTIQDPLSPLLTPSVENEMVKSITNTNPESCGGGGGGSGSSAACTFANAIINNTHTSEVISTSSSSLQQQQTQPKKRHSSSDDVHSERIAAAECQQQTENKNGLHCLAEPSNINNTSACPPNKKRRDSQEKSDTACSTYSSHLQHINTEMQST